MDSCYALSVIAIRVLLTGSVVYGQGSWPGALQGLQSLKAMLWYALCMYSYMASWDQDVGSLGWMMEFYFGFIYVGKRVFDMSIYQLRALHAVSL